MIEFLLLLVNTGSSAVSIPLNWTTIRDEIRMTWNKKTLIREIREN